MRSTARCSSTSCVRRHGRKPALRWTSNSAGRARRIGAQAIDRAVLAGRHRENGCRWPGRSSSRPAGGGTLDTVSSPSSSRGLFAFCSHVLACADGVAFGRADDGSLVSSFVFSPSRLARNSASRLVTTVLGQGAKAIVAVLVARYLGAADFGTFSVAWTIAGIAAYYGAFGIDHLLVRELNRPLPRIDFRRTLPLVSMLGAAVAVLLVVGAVALPGGTRVASAIIAATPYVLTTGAVLVVNATFHARERMELEAVTEGIEGAVGLLAAWIVLHAGGGVESAILALSLGRFANLLAAWLIHRRLPRLVRPTAPLGAWRTVRLGAPMGVSRGLRAVTQRIDIVILGLFVTATEVGVYSAAVVAVIAAADTLGQVGRVAYPAMSRAEHAQDPDLRKAVRLVWRVKMLVVVSAVVGLAVLAEPIVELLFGAEFAAAGPMLAVLSITMLARVFASFGGYVLYAVDRPWDRVRTLSVTAVVKIVACFAAVPMWGVWGGVWAAVITDLVYVGMMLWWIRAIRPPWFTGAGAALLVAVPVGVVAAAIPGPVVVRVVSGAATFSVLVVAGRARLRRPAAITPPSD